MTYDSSVTGCGSCVTCRCHMTVLWLVVVPVSLVADTWQFCDRLWFLCDVYDMWQFCDRLWFMHHLHVTRDSFLTGFVSCVSNKWHMTVPWQIVVLMSLKWHKTALCQVLVPVWYRWHMRVLWQVAIPASFVDDTWQLCDRLWFLCDKHVGDMWQLFFGSCVT